VDVLRVLARLVLVKDVQELAEHLAAWVRRDGLGDRYELHPRLAQLPHIEFGMERVATEPTQRTNDNEGERTLRPRRFIDHLLKDGSILVERGSARLAENLDGLPTLALAEGATLGDLVRQREVAFGLPGRGDSRVNCVADHGSVPVAQYGVDFVAQKGPPQGELAFVRREAGIDLPRAFERRPLLMNGASRGFFVSASLGEVIGIPRHRDDQAPLARGEGIDDG
jgi:hypothetical protein